MPENNTMRRMFTKKQIEEIAKGKLGPAISALEEKALTGVLPVAYDPDGFYYIDEDDMDGLESGAYKLVNEEEGVISVFFFFQETKEYFTSIGSDLYKGQYVSGDLAFTSSNAFDPIAQIQAGNVENAKPIYCHPVYFYKSKEYRAMSLIFTNSPTPFTPTTLADWIDDLYSQVSDAIRIILNGGFKDSNDDWCVATHFGKNTTGFYFSGITMSGGNSSFSGLTKQQFIDIVTEGFADGVNKIN